MPRIVPVVVATVAVVAVPGVAHAARHRPPRDVYEFPAKDAAAKKRLAQQSEITGVINGAQAHVFAKRRSCQPKSPFAVNKPSTTDAPSDPGFAAVLAALRRPATPADAAPAGPGGHTFGTTHTDSVRTLVAANGVRATVSVASSVRTRFHLSASCLAAERDWVHHLLRGRTHAVRVGALKLFARIARDASKPVTPPTPVDGLYLYVDHGSTGGGGGGASVAQFLARGLFFSSGGPRGTAGRHSTLTGVVPDGVASVTLDYPRVVHRGRNFRDTVYPHAYSRTVKVTDNLVDVRVPRDGADAFAPRMVWRSADGSVRHVVHSPVGY